MTIKDMSPEVALAQTLVNIQNVITTVNAFMQQYHDETFEGADYTKFRDSGKKTKEHVSYWRRLLVSEYVTLGTLRNYGVVNVNANRKEQIVINSNYTYSYKLNNGKILDYDSYLTLKKVFDDADTLFQIEEIEGEILNATIYTYKINEERFAQLQDIANTLRDIVEK